MFRPQHLGCITYKRNVDDVTVTEERLQIVYRGTKTAPPPTKADQYDDPTHNYLQYWHGRDYEHAAEEMAIRRLLTGKTFRNAMDVVGGYGRLCVVLEDYADKVTLAEPSRLQLEIARTFLKDHPGIARRLLQADDLRVPDGSIDLLTMVRVMHHLPDPSREFVEISRILANDGNAIIEVANYLHARNRIKHVIRRAKLPTQPLISARQRTAPTMKSRSSTITPRPSSDSWRMLG